VARAACLAEDGVGNHGLAEVHDVQSAYAQIRHLREAGDSAKLPKLSAVDIADFVQLLLTSYSGEWLLMFEVYEWLLGATECSRYGFPTRAVRDCLRLQPPQDPELVGVLLQAINRLEKCHGLG
jgi:hypothetical protein